MSKQRRGRRGNGEGGCYQLPNGQWRVSHTIGVLPNGRPHRVYRVRKTRADALAALGKLKDGTDTPARKPSVVPPSQGQPVKEIKGVPGTMEYLLRHWLAVIEPDIEENTLLSYTNAIENHLIPKLGTIRPRNLEVKDVETALSGIVVGQKGKRTRQNAYVVLNSALKKGVIWGDLKENPCEKIKKPEAKRKDIFPFTLDESQHFIKTVSATGSIRDEALFRLALTTGMRSGEVFGLHRDALNLKAKTVHIYQQATEINGNLRIKKPKSKTSIRTIDLTDKVVDCLKRQLKWLDTNGLADCQIVFPNETGGYLRRGSFSKWCLRPWLKAADLKYRGFHHFRHTAATLMLANWVEVAVVTAILGHSKQATTLELYGHVLPGRRDNARKKMGELLG